MISAPIPMPAAEEVVPCFRSTPDLGPWNFGPLR
jgi:hypothetical protein